MAPSPLDMHSKRKEGRWVGGWVNDCGNGKTHLLQKRREEACYGWMGSFFVFKTNMYVQY